MSSVRQKLPVVPNADNLRKQAKRRLTALRVSAASTQLADAQRLIAREYGFANWAALLAEVARRQESPAARYRKIQRQPTIALFPPPPEETHSAHISLLTSAASASIFALMVGIGGSIVCFLGLVKPGAMSRLQDISALLHQVL